MTTIADLRSRALPPITGSDGVTWTPRVPRRFTTATGILVRVTSKPAPSGFAHVEALAAHQAAHAPFGPVAVASLTEVL